MSEDMPIECPKICQIEIKKNILPDKISKDLPIRMADRMSKDMPDRMPKDMPDRNQKTFHFARKYVKRSAK